MKRICDATTDVDFQYRMKFGKPDNTAILGPLDIILSIRSSYSYSAEFQLRENMGNISFFQ